MKNKGLTRKTKVTYNIHILGVYFCKAPWYIFVNIEVNISFILDFITKKAFYRRRPAYIISLNGR